jgi:hypothetical protein
MVKRPQKPRILPPDPNVTAINHTVPMSHEKLIGRFVVEWSKLEGVMDDLIWRFLDMPVEYGRIVTSHVDATGKIKLLTQLIETSFGHSSPDYIMFSYFEEILDHVDIIRIDRNLIIHGTWGRNSINIPISMSLRIRDTPSTIVSETFDDIRMKDLIRKTLDAKWAMIYALDSASAAHHRSRKLFQMLLSNHQPNPGHQT